jgi:hypothetical protein
MELFTMSVLAQDDLDAGGAAAGIGSLLFGCFGLLLVVVIVAGYWKVFAKAGKPGWACLVPIYNVIVLAQIVGREVLWIILALIPCTAPIAVIVMSIDLAKSFGKDTVYGLGLAFLPFIFFPLLGFGDAAYRGPAAAQSPAAA